MTWRKKMTWLNRIIRRKKTGEWFSGIIKMMKRKKAGIADMAALSLFAVCFFFAVGHDFQYDRELTACVRLFSPWMVKEGSAGEMYIVDKEKSRIILVKDNQVREILSAGSPKGASFGYANSICVSEKGTVYVLDTGWSGDGLSVDFESILRYEPGGENILGERRGLLCYRVDYEKDSCDKPRLFAPVSAGDFLYFISADETGFALNRLNPDTSENEVLYRRKMERAVTLIQDFIIDPSKQAVYAIDKRGKLLYTDAVSDKVRTVYTRNNKSTSDTRKGTEEESAKKTVFYHGALGEDGSIYVTDIASGRLLRYHMADGGMEEKTVLEGEKIWNVSWGNGPDKEPRLSFVSGDYVRQADQDGNQVFQTQAFKKSSACYIKEIIYDASLFAASVCALWLILRLLFIARTLKLTRTQRTGALLLTTVLAVSFILVSSLLDQFRSVYKDQLLEKLSMTAQIIGGKIEEPDLEALEKPENYMGESYLRLWNSMNQVLDRRMDYGRDIYCNLLRFDGSSGYAAAYLDNSIGTYYPLTEEETREAAGIYQTGNLLKGEVKQETGSYLYVMAPVKNEAGAVFGIVSVGTLSSVIERKVSEMAGEIVIAVIMLLLAVLFLFGEALSYFELKEAYRGSGGKDPSGAGAKMPMHQIRISIFIAFFAFNMATSFLPVYILRFAGPQTGLLRAVAGSLPMTLNLICVGITSLVCPRLMARFGFGILALFGSLFALCGDLTMALCPSYAFVAAGLMINGIGVGLVTNSLHILLASLTADGESENGFSLFNAASLSGVNCGMLLGSALAQRIGQNHVFFVSAGVWAIAAIQFLSFGKTLQSRKMPWAGAARFSLCRFLLSPSVLKFLLCIQVPYIVLNSFVYYYVPIYGSSQGFSENVTSLLIITCSLLSVYLSAVLTGRVSKKMGENSIYLAGLLNFAGLMWFAFRMTPLSLFLALCCIGVAGSFGPAVRISRFLRLKESVEYGEENAMGSYDFVDNLGESGGSMIFAGIISIGFRTGITVLLGCIAALNFIYALSERAANAGRRR